MKMRTFGEVSVDEVREKALSGDNGVLLVDVRERDEWEEGRIPGAIHAPLSEFGDAAERLLESRDGEVVLYCHSGSRSARAAEYLASRGHPEVSNMEGGIAAWAARSYEIDN